MTAAVRGSPVLESMLAPKGSGSGLQALIPPGMRAITVEINEFSGVAGNLVPGCRVDVVASINGEGGGEMVSRTIVQNVRVTAIGMRRPTPEEEKGGSNGGQMKSVTLLTTPKEAEAIELAAATGRPRLVLRSGADNGTANSEGVTVGELRGARAPKKDPFQQVELIKPVSPIALSATPTTQPIARTRQVKVIRAGVESEVTIEDPSLVQQAGPKWITGAGTEELNKD
jgi:pilus assembly protein CpaB